MIENAKEEQQQNYNFLNTVEINWWLSRTEDSIGKVDE